jgi:hypothetical protein
MPVAGQSQTKSRVENTTPNVTTSTTVASKPEIPTVESSGLQNVLNNYRSSTYLFTLAALQNKFLQDPDLYRSSALNYVILKSGGKGLEGISTNVTGIEKKVGEETIREGGRVLGKKDIMGVDFTGSALVEGFNKDSPGRFDMFISNVEINSLFGFTNESSVSHPTSIKFEVTEPYSLNGFIESLHVAAVAAGYPNYLQAVFVLKVEFVGYPDDSDLPSPEIIKGTERYFPFVFTGIDVEVTSQGTKYRCSAVPSNERAGFGQSNKLKKPINMTGGTVGEILKDLMLKVTNQLKEADNSSKTSTASASQHDSFDIKFPVWGPNGLDFSQENEIAGKKIIKELKDQAVYKFEDPATTTKPSAYKPTRGAPKPAGQRASPGAAASKPQIQFNEGAMLTNIVAAIIRDSDYTKDLLSKLGTAEGIPDQYGYVDYFVIRAQATNKDVYDDVQRRHFVHISYIVHPYKIHYKRIPGYAGNQVSESKLKILSLREYNYMYTGKNVDVLNFKLNFNNLFFESVPLAMGNTTQPNRKFAAGPDGSKDVKVAPDNRTDISNSSIGTPPMYADTQANDVQQQGGEGNQRQDDPYAAFAKSMHSAIVDSKASMLTADLEILGDPFYLVTGGVGNYNPAPSANYGINKNGEANHTFREVLITLNFRNPVDINRNGYHEFDPKRVPWSGIYRVNEVTHTFNEGLFKQTLKLMRVPGQILGDNTKETPVTNKFKLTPKILDVPATPTTVGVDAGRPSELNLLLQQSRGLPSPGLPGVLSNFTSALGGAGSGVSSLLNQVSGAVSNGIGKLTSAASVFGGAIPGGVNQLASGIRLQASGITNLATQVLGSAALVNQVANSVQNNFPVTNASQQIANNIVSQASAVVNAVSVKGSGIGEGATVLVNAASSFVPTAKDTVTALDVKSLTNQLPTSIQSFAGIGANLKLADIANVQNLGASAASIVGGVGSKVSGLTAGISTDPTAIASQFGINASQLSGLSNNLKSKVLDQVSDIAKTIPENVDFNKAVSQGIALDYIPKDKFANIPATTPYRVAPSAEINVQDLQTIAATGGNAAVARAFGVTDISKVSTNLLPASVSQEIFSLSNPTVNNPLSGLSKQFNLTDSTALGGKVLSASNQLSGITGVTGSVESQLNSVKSLVGNTINSGNNLALSVTSQFGSSTSDMSPLKKLIGG